jgi:hypothetical protein
VAFGAAGGAAFGYFLHNYLQKSAPTYAALGQGGKLVLGGLLLGSTAFLSAEYMENRCRRIHNLPTKGLEVRK